MARRAARELLRLLMASLTKRHPLMPNDNDLIGAGAEAAHYACTRTTAGQAMSVLIERLAVAVTYDPARGYVRSAAGLRQPVVALSLGGLRRRIDHKT
jgi:hypothetical protein